MFQKGNVVAQGRAVARTVIIADQSLYKDNKDVRKNSESKGKKPKTLRSTQANHCQLKKTRRNMP